MVSYYVFRHWKYKPADMCMWSIWQVIWESVKYVTCLLVICAWLCELFTEFGKYPFQSDHYIWHYNEYLAQFVIAYQTSIQIYWVGDNLILMAYYFFYSFVIYSFVFPMLSLSFPITMKQGVQLVIITKELILLSLSDHLFRIFWEWVRIDID